MSAIKKDLLNTKKALLLNFTANSYHWGCYGTSMEIYQSLLEKNYYIEMVGVHIIHSIEPTVEKLADFDDISFFKRFSQNNNNLLQSIQISDTIIVNGEGTLHRQGKGSLNLLFLIYISKKYFNKVTHVINFSCFPNGDKSLPKGASKIYAGVLKYVDGVCTRDLATSHILSKGGVKITQAFDCLPRFINRHNLANSHNPKGYILVSGGVTFNESRYELLVNFIHYFLKKGISVKFLYGAHFSPAIEDVKLQEKLKGDDKLGELKIVQANTMLEWIEEFQSASFLFSARFHHSIAALSIGTPFRYLNSNTPKIEAMLETLEEKIEDFYIDEKGINILISSANKALANHISIKSKRRLDKMMTLANENFSVI